MKMTSGLIAFTFLAILVSSACAPAGSGGSTTRDVTVIGTGEGNLYIERQLQREGGVARVEAGIEDSWSALRSAYDRLSIPIGQIDPGARTLGNSQLMVRRQLGTVRLSRYLRCGTALGVPVVDSEPIRMVVVSRLEARDGGTIVRTDVRGYPQGTGTTASRSECTSTGLLEAAIARALELEVALITAGRDDGPIR